MLWKSIVLAFENAQHVPSYVEYPHRDALIQQVRIFPYIIFLELILIQKVCILFNYCYYLMSLIYFSVVPYSWSRRCLYREIRTTKSLARNWRSYRGNFHFYEAVSGILYKI